MTATTKDLEHLVRTAASCGAIKARAILASSIVMDPRVELKCRVPLCPNYGRNLTCPPHVMSPDRFAQVLGRYSHAILVQKEYAWDSLREKMKGATFQQLESSPEYQKMMRVMFKDFLSLMSTMESESMKLGYRFSAALVGGPCCLCDECAGPGEKCRHTMQARPSMEAMGIDVMATAASAQMPIPYPATESAILTGVLLVE